VTLIEFEFHLDVPGPETLTFFSHRHHSRAGNATLEWLHPVTVAGGTGPGWYSTGPIALPLIAGNHYTLGVSWAGNVTYYYTTGPTNTPVSFGSWQRAHTTTNPPPTTLALPAGVDVAQYYQRLTTVATPIVVNTGTSCTTAMLEPRLVASGPFAVNTTESLELVDAAATSIALFALANGPALPAPLPLFGCDLWLDLAGGFATFAAITDGTGYGNLDITVPNSPGLFGVQFSSQCLVFGPAIDVTNTVSFTII
jgi:hypothetical protein